MRNITFLSRSTVYAAAIAVCGAGASAQTLVPFTETFDFGNAGFEGTSEGLGATFVATGGGDNSGFITETVAALGGMGTTVFAAEVIGAGTVVFDENGDPQPASPPASGGAFFGDFIESGITGVTFDIRHDSAEDVVVGLRIAPPPNFPGAFPSFDQFVTLGATSEFQTIAFDISSLATVGFEGAPTPANFEAVFGNVGNLQVFVSGDAIVGTTFDLDNFGIVPEPASLVLVAAGALATLGRRRTRG